MRAWPRARRAGIQLFVACSFLLIIGAKGRVQIQARVVDTSVAQGVARLANDEIRRAQTVTPAGLGTNVHVVEGCAFRLQWIEETDNTPRRVLQVESLGS